MNVLGNMSGESFYKNVNDQYVMYFNDCNS